MSRPRTNFTPSEKIKAIFEQQKAEEKANDVSLAPKNVEAQKREAFRIWWTQNQKKYQQSKNLEDIIWEHLKAVEMTDEDSFQEGVEHFGLKSV